MLPGVDIAKVLGVVGIAAAGQKVAGNQTLGIPLVQHGQVVAIAVLQQGAMGGAVDLEHYIGNFAGVVIYGVVAADAIAAAQHGTGERAGGIACMAAVQP